MNPFTVRARFSFSLAFGAVSLSLAILACAIGFASDDLPGAEARAQIGDDGENEAEEQLVLRSARLSARNDPARSARAPSNNGNAKRFG